LHASGGSGLALLVLLGVLVADALQAGAGDDATPAPRNWVDSAPLRPLWQPVDRGWVDRGP
jgi:hypothetical protein